MKKVTPFRKKVRDATRKIPRGKAVTGGRLAKRIGCGSARAVGQVLKVNPLTPEAPCHESEGVAFADRGRVRSICECKPIWDGAN